MAAPDREPDACVVPTAPVAAILRDFVKGWQRDRPSVRARRGAPADVVEPITAYDWLSADTGLTRGEIMQARWPNRRPRTELRIADAIVASIGDPSAFHDGRITIEPNPAATPERRAECCGGSTPPSTSATPNSLTG